MKSPKRWAVVALVAAGALAAAGAAGRHHLDTAIRNRRADALTGAAEFHRVALKEPSGVAYHRGRGTLIAVSDDGTLVEMDLSFKVLHVHESHGDLEGVAVLDETGTVFVSVENEVAIFEYDLDAQRILRTLNVNLESAAEFKGRAVRNKGLEGVTIAPGADGVSRLYCIVESEPARVIVLSAEVSAAATARARGAGGTNQRGVIETVSVTSSIDVGLPRISDIMFDVESGRMLLTSAAACTLTVMDLSGGVERTVRLPGVKPEGFCFIPNGDGIVADDKGGLFLCNGMRAEVLPSTGAGAPQFAR